MNVIEFQGRCLTTVNILIKNGRVIDGTGNPWFKADVLIKGKKVDQIAPEIKEKADKIIDAKGLIVSPGFIDIHTHSDFTIMRGYGENALSQGVATHVIGNCGFSLTPIDLRKIDDVALVDQLGAVLGIKDYKLQYESLDQYLAGLEKNGIPVNAVPLVGHSVIRFGVLGLESRAPTESELKLMQDCLESEMKMGAFGMSTGLDYPPGSFAKKDEIIKLCKVVAKYNGLYATHFRGLFGGLRGATREAIKIGEIANCRVQISHFKPFGFWRGTITKAYNLVEQARARGVDVSFDVFPQASNYTFLFAMAPPWLYMGKKGLDLEGGIERLKRTKSDPEYRTQVHAEMAQLGSSFLKITKAEEWDRVIFNVPGDPIYNGKSAYEVAQEQSIDPKEVIVDVLIKRGADAGASYLSMTEEDNRITIAHPLSMFASDGKIYPVIDGKVEGHPNPYCYGTYTQVLGKYVREEKLLSLPEAIRKMTSFPAQKLGLKNRGLLREGYWADITIFDKDRVIDKSTYKNPTQHSEGIEYMLVNGTIALEKSEFKYTKSGMPITKPVKSGN